MAVRNDSCPVFPAACLQQVKLCQAKYLGVDTRRKEIRGFQRPPSAPMRGNHSNCHQVRSKLDRRGLDIEVSSRLLDYCTREAPLVSLALPNENNKNLKCGLAGRQSSSSDKPCLIQDKGSLCDDLGTQAAAAAPTGKAE